ncbi:hypothetical protein GCM10008938_37320 [Deinococcus roseus]|uniref:Double zinc ribbon domain-containing protein n=1 Tax=Deinococcus roseus TaxID=392414 RepID=A0ABQ2D800_9DEIO|nr:hypothetical protein GCM10008938_37320 [Deinococcus roseus]
MQITLLSALLFMAVLSMSLPRSLQDTLQGTGITGPCSDCGITPAQDVPCHLCRVLPSKPYALKSDDTKPCATC